MLYGILLQWNTKSKKNGTPNNIFLFFFSCYLYKSFMLLHKIEHDSVKALFQEKIAIFIKIGHICY
jgi:hypothetical protein